MATAQARCLLQLLADHIALQAGSSHLHGTPQENTRAAANIPAPPPAQKAAPVSEPALPSNAMVSPSPLHGEEPSGAPTGGAAAAPEEAPEESEGTGISKLCCHKLANHCKCIV